jgi:hypothetical protein
LALTIYGAGRVIEFERGFGKILRYKGKNVISAPKVYVVVGDGIRPQTNTTLILLAMRAKRVLSSVSGPMTCTIK